MKNLLALCKDVTNWHTLGLHLDLKMSQLGNIEVTYRADGIERKKSEMFNAWLHSCPSASWDDLIAALKKIDKITVASEIETGNE